MGPNSFKIPLLAALVFVGTSAVAQTKDAKEKDAKPAAVAPTPPTTPERTTASFGDWILRCETPPQQKRVCEVAEIVTLQGQASPVAQVALGKVAPNEAMRLTVVLPVNIAIPAAPLIVGPKADGVKSELAWQSCTAAGCFASGEVSADAISAYGAQTEAGRILFKDAAGREIALPLSFRGLTQAMAALAKEM